MVRRPAQKMRRFCTACMARWKGHAHHREQMSTAKTAMSSEKLNCKMRLPRPFCADELAHDGVAR
jgi:hypothetical protein